MTHIELMIEFFKARGGTATLREILSSGMPFAHEFNARKTDLRKQGRYDLILVRGKTPSENSYSLIERPLSQPELVAA